MGVSSAELVDSAPRVIASVNRTWLGLICIVVIYTKVDLRIKLYVIKLNRYKQFGFYIKSMEFLAESSWVGTTVPSLTKRVFNLRVVKCAMMWTMVKWAYLVIRKGIGWAYIAHAVEGCAWSPLAGVQFALLMQSCNLASESPVMSHTNGSLVVNRLNFALLKLYLILLKVNLIIVEVSSPIK